MLVHNFHVSLAGLLCGFLGLLIHYSQSQSTFDAHKMSQATTARRHSAQRAREAINSN